MITNEIYDKCKNNLEFEKYYNFIKIFYNF